MELIKWIIKLNISYLEKIYIFLNLNDFDVPNMIFIYFFTELYEVLYWFLSKKSDLKKIPWTSVTFVLIKLLHSLLYPGPSNLIQRTRAIYITQGSATSVMTNVSLTENKVCKEKEVF